VLVLAYPTSMAHPLVSGCYLNFIGQCVRFCKIDSCRTVTDTIQPLVPVSRWTLPYQDAERSSVFVAKNHWCDWPEFGNFEDKV
jgi:hypothetical protein